MLPFGLQLMAFCVAIDGLLHCNLPPFTFSLPTGKDVAGAYSLIFCGPLTFSVFFSPLFISMFTPSLRPVVTFRRS